MTPYSEMSESERAAVQSFKDSNPVFTVQQAAAALGVSTRTVMTMLADGRLHGVKLAGRWRISRDALEKILHGDV